MEKSDPGKPSLFTALSPLLLDLYDLRESIVVIIDVLRATSTIATALNHGAREIIPVNSVQKCIELSKQLEAVSAGERDGKIAAGLQYGNSPSTYSAALVGGKIVVITTTNGTRLLHQALSKDAEEIITGAFVNLSAVCNYLIAKKKNVVLACSGWRNRVNLEDTLFAGAVVHEVRHAFNIQCDASVMSENLYLHAGSDLFQFMKKYKASHYLRLSGYGMESDIEYCLRRDVANVLPVYRDGRLVPGTPAD